MKKRMYVLVLIAVISLLASASIAITPTVTVYFDEALTTQSADCLKPGVLVHRFYSVLPMPRTSPE